MSNDTETIDKLFLELSQFTTAKTAVEIALMKDVERLHNIVSSVVRTLDVLVHENTRAGYDPSILTGATWGKVAYVCGLGSTSAIELCREFGVDPHYEAKPQREQDR